MLLRRLLTLELSLFGLLSIAAAVSLTGFGVGHAVADTGLSRFFGYLSLTFGLLWGTDLAAMVATIACWLLQSTMMQDAVVEPHRRQLQPDE